MMTQMEPMDRRVQKQSAHIYGHLICDNDDTMEQWEKDGLFNTWYQLDMFMEKKKVSWPISHTYTKINSRWISDRYILSM